MNAAWEEGGDAQLASLRAILARCQRLSAPVLIATLSLLQGKQKKQKTKNNNKKKAQVHRAAGV